MDAPQTARLPTRRIWLAACAAVALFLSFILQGKAMDDQNGRPDSAAILSAILGDGRFQLYFHQETHPERYPLLIVDAAGADLSAPMRPPTGAPASQMKAEGQPTGERAELIVERFEMSDGRASVAFTFPVEGIRGTAELTRAADKGWRVETMHLVEG